MDRGVVYTTSQQKKNHMRTSQFESLAYLIGEPLTIVRGITFQGGHAPDGEVKIIGEWPKTILLDMEFVISRWGLDIPPRHVRQMIPKAAIVSGDVILKRIHGGPITPDMVSKWTKTTWYREEDEIL